MRRYLKHMAFKLLYLLLIILLIIPAANALNASDLEKYLDRISDKKADIVFVFDNSGSMGGEIYEMRSISKNFASSLNESGIDYRLGLVAFRDFPVSCKRDEVTVECGGSADYAYRIYGDGNLTPDIRDFDGWLASLQAMGGKDEPESILPAIRHSLADLQWRSDAEKLIILITDAYPHPDGDCCNRERDTLKGTVAALTTRGVRLCVVGPDKDSLKGMANSTGGSFYRIRSGMTLKPILESISGAMRYGFKIELETSCINGNLQVIARLIGREEIPYQRGQTQAWLFVRQGEENSTRYDLVYNNATRAYRTDVAGFCGPAVKLTVYGRVGNWSSSVIADVDYGSQITKVETDNLPPLITSLTPVPGSPQVAGTAILWTARASDPENDPLVYQFLLNNSIMQDWSLSNTWRWRTSDSDVGVHHVYVRARDGKHSNGDGLDSSWVFLNYSIIKLPSPRTAYI
ncbi:von Willebrand factor type A domain protein [uncultured archaeon]|nr:von Willebrand factor type A domain protein [uncultured archaeon]